MSLKKDEFSEIIVDTEAEPAPEVEIDARVKGKQEAVKKAMRSLAQEPEGAGGSLQTSEDRAETFQEEIDERLMQHLANPKCKVVVKRTDPVSFQGFDCEGEVFQMECPVSLADIKSRIMRDHGGSKYRVSVHPNTPTGSMRTLSAFPLEVPGDVPPILAEMEDPTEMPQAGRRRGQFRFPQESEWADSLDPHAIDSGDPAVMISNIYRTQAKNMSDKLRLQQLKKSVKDLQLEDDEENGPRDNPHLLELRNELAETRLEQKLEAKLSSLESKLSSGQNGNEMMIAMMKMQEAANQANNQMRNDMAQQQMAFITSMMEINRKPGAEETFDGQMDRMVKMKEMMEGKGTKRVEDIMYDLLSDKLNGGTSDEDPVTVALKEGMAAIKPVLLELVSKNKPPTDSLTKDEARVAYEEAGRKEASKLVNRLQTQERQNQQAHLQAAQVQAARSNMVRDPHQPAPIRQPVPVVPPTPVPVEAPPHNLSEELPIPPSPTEPGYDRKAAVNFVIDAIIDDIQTGAWRNEEDSYVIGDFLDRLDPEILHDFTNVHNGEELNTLVEPYAEKKKLDFIVDRGKDNKQIEGWIEHILVTVKNYVLRGESGPYPGTAPGAPPQVIRMDNPTHVTPPVIPSMTDPIIQGEETYTEPKHLAEVTGLKRVEQELPDGVSKTD
jgi:hypothetical protein